MRPDPIVLTVEKPVYGGDCLAHLPGDGKRAGKAVFVPLTLPGETVSARVVEEKKNFAQAELEEVLTASPDRVEAACEHFGVCGGCQYQHAAYPAQVEMKRRILAETLARAGVVVPGEIAVLAKEPLGYRNRIRLALACEGSVWRFGYRGRKSHQIVAVDECPIAAPGLIETAKSLADFLSSTACSMPLSEMELFCNGDESRVLLTLFCESAADGITSDWLDRLKTALPAAIGGVRVQVADGPMVPGGCCGCGCGGDCV